MSIVITGNPGVGKHTISKEVAKNLELDILDLQQVKIMIVLRRNPYDLITVYKDRGYTDKKSIENTGSEVLGIIVHDAKSKFQNKVFQVNSSGKSIEDVVKKVMSIISSNKGNEEVDWLDLVTKNNDLKKFFVDWLNNALRVV